MQTIALSENAAAVLRAEINGWRARPGTSRLPAYRELAEAGLMEPVPGSETRYRFTQDGRERGEQYLDACLDRLEPPVSEGVELSDGAEDLLRRRLAGERVEVTDESRPLYRELVAAGMMIPLHTFALGRDSAYRPTKAACDRRANATSIPAPSA